MPAVTAGRDYNSYLPRNLHKPHPREHTTKEAGPYCAALEKRKGAFTPDANEALSASDLHVKSMQRHDRHSAARFARMRRRELSVSGV